MANRPGSKIEEAMRLTGGLVTNFPSHSIARSQSPDAQNFDPSDDSGVTKRKGFDDTATYIGVATGTEVSGLYAAALSTATVNPTDYLLLASFGTLLYSLDPGTGPPHTWTVSEDITGSSTITNNSPVRMRMFSDKVIICNKGGGPYKYTGTGDITALGGSPPGSSQGVTVHKGRAFLWGGSDKSKINWCAGSNPEDWTTAEDAGNENVYINDGMVINGLESNGDVLFVSKLSLSGKEGAIYGYFGDSPKYSTIKRVSHFGAVSQEGMFSYDGVLIVASERGIFTISGRGVALISRDIQDIYEDIPDKSTISIGRHLNQIWFSYRDGASSTNNAVLVLDISRSRWSKYTGINARRFANAPDGRLLSGRDGSTIVLDEQVKGDNDDGSAINFYWTTPDLDWGEFWSDKVPKSLHLHAKDTGNFNLTMTRYLDGELQTDSTPYTFTVQAAGNIDRVVERMVLPSADRNVKFVRFRLANNAADQPMTIFGYAAYANILEPTR